MAAPRIIKGNDLMVFDSEGKSYAYATNHTLTMSAETSDTSSKDHGMWGASEVTRFTWEITSENLYTSSDYDKMFNSMIAGEFVTVTFGLKKDESGKTVVDDYETLPNWSKDTTGNYYTGKTLITSLTANANNGENATYSVTFTGVGKISKA